MESQSGLAAPVLEVKAFEGGYAGERRRVAGHLEETGLELDVPDTVEQLLARREALSADRAAPV
jgi:hypothetical protein